MKKSEIIKRLLVVFVILLIVNLLNEVIQASYLHSNFDYMDLLNKLILESGVLVITGIIFMSK